MLKHLFVLFLIISAPSILAQQFVLNGTVSDSATGEQSIGALVFIKGTNKGVSTNAYGFYSLSLEKGEYEVVCTFIGYGTYTKRIQLDKNVSLNINLASKSTTLSEVVISAEKDEQQEQIRSTQMGAINIPIEQIKTLPTIGGETDIIKVMQLMPGVKRGSDGQNTLLVRGGNGDDNLLLLDEAVVYNVSHLFGFFSVFNNDALKDVTMYKGGFPAQYGGRLSSVMDIRMKEGDMQKFQVHGGIGLLSSHLTVEGPIIKNKVSFLVSGRRSYIDQVFKLAFKSNVLPYYFYDVNYKFNYIINKKDRVYLSGYYGNDVLKTSGENDSSFYKGGFTLGNFTNTLRWNHIYKPRLFSNVSLIFTRFKYDVEAFIPNNSFLTRSSIADIGVKIDYNYYPNPENTVKFGAYYTNHLFKPNVVNTSGEVSEIVVSRPGARKYTNDFGFYANNDWRIDSAFKLNYGARLSLLVTEGILYAGFEPRITFNYTLNEKNSFKVGYSRMKQYLHLVSNSSIALPTDLWYPVTKNVKPLKADQIAVSYNRLFKKIKTSLTIETYYKWINNMIEYREGAVLLLNDKYENELVKGKGWAYGTELFLSKTKGKLTGWIGYTLSWAYRQFPDLNGGQAYLAKFDRRHDFSFVGSYEFTKRFSISAVYVYSTGQRFTPLVGNYFVPNSSYTGVDLLPVFGKRNSAVFPNTSRFDINFIIKTRSDREILRYQGEWHFGAYNFFNRAQPNKVEIVSNGNSYKYQAKGLFGFIPFIAYNLNF
jgi:CarboxypepD_reg-like domain/TonB-dependent Receptor Plug Domain